MSLASRSRTCFVCGVTGVTLHHIHNRHLEKVKSLVGKDIKKQEKLEKAKLIVGKPKILVCCNHLSDGHPKELTDDGVNWFKAGMDGSALITPSRRPPNTVQISNKIASTPATYSVNPTTSPVAKRTRSAKVVPVATPSHAPRSPPIKQRLPYSFVMDKAARLKELKESAVAIAGSEDDAKQMLTDYCKQRLIEDTPKLELLRKVISTFKASSADLTQLEVAVFALQLAPAFDVSLTQTLASDLCDVSQATVSRAENYISLMAVSSFCIFGFTFQNLTNI